MTDSNDDAPGDGTTPPPELIRDLERAPECALLLAPVQILILYAALGLVLRHPDVMKDGYASQEMRQIRQAMRDFYAGFAGIATHLDWCDAGQEAGAPIHPHIH